jgi:GDP-mannose 6-dehydrogenase
MRLSIFGLGYVGAVTAACFAKEGHTVIGVDVNQEKVDSINRGQSPIIEEGIGELIDSMVKAGKLSATVDAGRAIQESEISLISVGTPSNSNGSLNLTHIKKVCTDIGEALKNKQQMQIIIVRSTMLPGTVRETIIPTIEKASGKEHGVGFQVCVNPEFLREGTSLKDFYSPPFTLIGADNEQVAATVAELYSRIDAPVYITELGAAEMVKYACNCFHALKVSFANEIGNLCKGVGIDSHKVMEIFSKDTKLNLSPYYLKPGFAFGGSCLPKDLRALNYKAKELDTNVPVLSSILESNRLQIERAIDMVLETGQKRVGVLGLSFKAGTDDLRESPIVVVAERLIGKGLKLAIYDRDVSLARLTGANKQYIENEIPHISSLMKKSIDEVVESSDVLVVGNKSDEFRVVESLGSNKIVIDLVRLFSDRQTGGQYHGICW